jgi:hypothetical protein
MSAAVAAAAAGAHLRRQDAEVVIDLLDSDSDDSPSAPVRQPLMTHMRHHCFLALMLASL